MREISPETKETVDKIIRKERTIRLLIFVVLLFLGFKILHIYPSDYSLFHRTGRTTYTIEDIQLVFGTPKQHLTEDKAVREKLETLMKKSEKDLEKLEKEPEAFSDVEYDRILHSNLILRRAKNTLENPRSPNDKLSLIEYDYQGSSVFIFFNTDTYLGAYPGFPEKQNNEQLFWKAVFVDSINFYTQSLRRDILLLRGKILVPFR